jgi:hypothetical protein
MCIAGLTRKNESDCLIQFPYQILPSFIPRVSINSFVAIQRKKLESSKFFVLNTQQWCRKLPVKRTAPGNKPGGY